MRPFRQHISQPDIFETHFGNLDTGIHDLQTVIGEYLSEIIVLPENKGPTVGMEPANILQEITDHAIRKHAYAFPYAPDIRPEGKDDIEGKRESFRR
jgi:hypothetical protein